MAARLSTTKSKTRTKSVPASTPAPNPRAVIGDNHGEEAERVQLISIVSKLSQADTAVEAAQVPLKAARAARSKIIGLGKAAGFTAKELEKRLDEMRMSTREMAALEVREHKHRRWLGSVEDKQAELILGDKVPAEAKDEAHWLGEGFKAGRRQLERRPADECPERFVQGWLGEYDRGLMGVLEANAPKKLTPVGEKAAADFANDNPDLDIKKAAAKLKSDAAFMDRTAPPEHDVATAPDGTTETDVEVSQEGDAPFEATEDELAAQSTRRAVQDAAEGRTSGETADVV